MICLNCDQRLVPAEVILSGEFRGEHFNIAMQGFKCEQCGYGTIHGRDSALFSRRLADAFRSRHGLLTSDEIKGARTRIGMSQGEFAVYLRVGVASVKRWESGQVQDEAMNELIRLKTDLWAAEQNVVVVKSALMTTEPTFEVAPPLPNQISSGRATPSVFLDTSAVLSAFQVWRDTLVSSVLPVIPQSEPKRETLKGAPRELAA